MANYSEAYLAAADDLIACMYSDKSEYESIRFQHGLQVGMLPSGLYRDTVKAIYGIYDNDGVMHDTLLYDRVASITPQWLAERVALYDDTRRGSIAAKNVQIVHKWGKHYAQVAILRRMTEQVAQSSVDDSTKAVNDLVDMLQGIGKQRTVKNVVAHEHAQRNRDNWNSKAQFLGHTGIPFLDDNSSGYESGHLWAIVGAYKQRKTTLASNLLLQATLNNNLSVAMYSREMLQNEVQAIIEAMLAYGVIDYHGKQDKPDANGMVAGQINAKLIQRFYGNYDKLGSIRDNAIKTAQSIYDGLSHRIYDTNAEHGGLSDFETLKAMILRDIAVHGGKLHIVDYAQKFRDGNQKEYEALLEVSNGLQTLAQQQKICIVLLAQQNESAISNGSGYGSGVSGGGALAKDVTYLWQVRYNNGVDLLEPNMLEVGLRFSRYSQQNKTMNLLIHPDSGLLINNRWLNQLKQAQMEQNL